MTHLQRKAVRRTLAAATAIAVAVLTIVAASAGDDDGTAPAAGPGVYKMEADHAVYDDLGALQSSSDVIVIGRVLSMTVDPGESPGNDAAGDPIPPIPHTEHLVQVDEVVRGAASASATIVVSLSGGTTQQGQFELDGGPALAVGDSRMFFLREGDDGKFYPLAGGSAVAQRQADGTYLVPAGATGGQALAVTPEQVRGRPGGGGSGGGSGAAVGGSSNSGSGANTPTPAPQPKADRTKPRVTVSLRPRQRLATVLKRGLLIDALCSETCLVTAQASVAAKVAKSLGLRRSRRALVVGTGRATRGSLALRLKAKARRALRGRLSVKLAVRVDARDEAGNMATVKRAVTVTRRNVLMSR